MTDLVSIIMPNYNCERFLKDSINSVLNQTYKNWELLIVDDCSTDNSLDIIKQFCNKDSRIKFFLNDLNSGAAASRNLALRKANGKWIAFLDSDDIWLPRKLEIQVSFMQTNGYDFTFTKYRQIDENSKKVGQVITAPKKISQKKLKYCCCYLGCLTVMYNAEKIGLVQIPDSILKRNDDAMWLKVRKYVDAYYLDELLAEYRVRKGSISHHRKLSLFKFHYMLYRQVEEMNVFTSALSTLKNIFYIMIKKIKYVKTERISK